MIKELVKYLEKITVISYYSITFSADNPNHINKWLVRSVPMSCAKKKGNNPYLDIEADIVLKHELPFISQEDAERNWRYYYYEVFDERQSIDYSRNTPEILFENGKDRYIYCLCSIYSSKDQFVLFNVDASVPVRIWINGHLVCVHGQNTNTWPYVFKLYIKKGLNTILVERTLCPENEAAEDIKHYFSIHFKPCNYFKDNKASLFIDEEYFDLLENTYSIIPEKTLFLPGEEISVTILQKSFEKAENERIRLSLYSASGQEIYRTGGLTSQMITMKIKQHFRGTILLKAESFSGRARTSYIYIFYGNFIEAINTILKKVNKTKEHDKKTIYELENIRSLYNYEKGVFSSAGHVLSQKLVYLLLERVAFLEKYSYIGIAMRKKKIESMYDSTFNIWMGKNKDSKSMLHAVCVSDAAADSRKERLCVYNQPFPALPYFYEAIGNKCDNGFLKQTVFLNIFDCFASDTNSSHEDNTRKIIDMIVQKYNIDKDKIYLISSCDGALKNLRPVVENPGLFSRIAVTGSMGMVWSKNKEHGCFNSIGETVLLELNNIDHPIFNASQALHAAECLKNAECYNFSNYGLNEFKMIFTSVKLLKKLEEKAALSNYVPEGC